MGLLNLGSVEVVGCVRCSDWERCTRNDRGSDTVIGREAITVSFCEGGGVGTLSNVWRWWWENLTSLSVEHAHPAVFEQTQVREAGDEQ